MPIVSEADQCREMLLKRPIRYIGAEVLLLLLKAPLLNLNIENKCTGRTCAVGKRYRVLL